MSTLQQLKQGLGRFWDSLSEGWQQLQQRAGHALTRFQPGAKRGELQTREEQIEQQASRWGLLAAELQEDEDSISVRLEAPGLDREHLDISVIDHHLVIRGEKHVQREQTQGRYHIMECAYGQFERALPLPAEVDDSGARARYRDGILTVTLPKAPHSRSRRIEVQG
ncbi:Hsp20/alpha crystallin family protein [Thiohalobacter thiocyanaticus]|uniref:Hsp20/alpha crystallin family protein n=1 Tax=Thiohalobacter thiocyanaticus TaxID=585455 RepID=A0A426QKF7_9GAMM|nr:Hsp20/alpha crystallin family protein [Thiohalobacter thiocyanaticus]RRQ22241.1 Hsp20/alpha crystallin family protein [Thiohalobacter thiocyanaticus]